MCYQIAPKSLGTRESACMHACQNSNMHLMRILHLKYVHRRLQLITEENSQQLQHKDDISGPV